MFRVKLRQAKCPLQGVNGLHDRSEDSGKLRRHVSQAMVRGSFAHLAVFRGCVGRRVSKDTSVIHAVTRQRGGQIVVARDRREAVEQ